MDWVAVATITAPILTLFIGAALDRFLERKSRIIVYFNHSAAFTLAGANPIKLHTHGIVIKNTGKRTARDIRVPHHVLPRDYQIYPDVQFSVQDLPGGGTELVFPSLVPNEQISIAYLYFPPLLFNEIHGSIRHSEGFATAVQALPTPQYPAWFLRSVQFLLIMGTIAFIYCAWEFILLIGRLAILLRH